MEEAEIKQRSERMAGKPQKEGLFITLNTSDWNKKVFPVLHIERHPKGVFWMVRVLMEDGAETLMLHSDGLDIRCPGWRKMVDLEKVGPGTSS